MLILEDVMLNIPTRWGRGTKSEGDCDRDGTSGHLSLPH